MANKRALTTVKYYGGKLGNLLLMFASHPSPCAGNFGEVTRSRGHEVARSPGGAVIGLGDVLLSWAASRWARRRRRPTPGVGPLPHGNPVGGGCRFFGGGSLLVVIKKPGAGCRFGGVSFGWGALFCLCRLGCLSCRVVQVVVLFAGWRVRPGPTG